MNSRSIRIIVPIVLMAFILSSCAPLPPPGTALTDEERASARKTCIARYTAAGAVGGALIGGLLGSKGAKWEMAAIGAAAGGTLAFAIAWGHCLSVYSDLRSYPVAGARETAQNIGYTPAQGNVTKIENFSLNPDGVAPGGRVQMSGAYYVMAPEGTQEVKVTETRTLHYFDPSGSNWKELGSVDNEITSALGTRRAEGNFDIPSDVPEGKYKVTLKVSAQGKEDLASQELTVRKGLAMGPASGGTGYQQAAYQEGSKSVDKKVRSVEVLSKTLNVRKEPSSKSEIIANIKQAEIFQAVNDTMVDQNKWFMIRLDDGTEGWVSGKNVRVLD